MTQEHNKVISSEKEERKQFFLERQVLELKGQIADLKRENTLLKHKADHAERRLQKRQLLRRLARSLSSFFRRSAKE